MDYKVLTKGYVYSPENDGEDYLLRLQMEQEQWLLSHGYNTTDGRDFLIEFADGKRVISSIDYALNILSLKDGADLVDFGDGNIGFVGWYSGFPIDKNHFKVCNIEEGVSNDYWTYKCIRNDGSSFFFADVDFDCVCFECDADLDTVANAVDDSVLAWQYNEEFEHLTIGEAIEKMLADKGYTVNILD